MNKQDDFDIREHIHLHAVTNGAEQIGWIHTHGMEQFDCPDLEIRGVPLFFMEPAVSLLNHVAQFMAGRARNKETLVKLGETMSTGPHSAFRFVKLDPIVGDEEHFTHERWALSDEPMRDMCDSCMEAACSGGSDCDDCDGCDGCDEPGPSETLN